MHSYTFRVVLFLALVASASSARAVQYSVTLLYKAGVSMSAGRGGTDGIQVGLTEQSTGPGPRAALWTDTPESIVDLHPAGAYSSAALHSSVDTQVGSATSSSSSFLSRAYLWHGTAASAVNLNRPGDIVSQANDVSGNRQVGWGLPTGSNHERALMWQGTAASAVDLTPAGMNTARANGIQGTQIVGYTAGASTANRTHAILWDGSAANYVDLHPADFSISEALDIDGLSQVGYAGNSSGNIRAMLWHGTAASAVDLHPATGYVDTRASSVAGNLQVGYGHGSSTGHNQHALLWQGTAASMVDLHAVLTSYGHDFTESTAAAITPNGSIIGSAVNTNTGARFAVLWTPVPEPGTGALLTILLLGQSLGFRPRRSRS